MKLAQRLNITPSQTIKINDLALQKRKAGIPVFNFSAGDPTLSMHPLIKDGLDAAFSKNTPVAYPPVAGIPNLRAQAALWMQKKSGASYTMEETIITPGGKFALFSAIFALLNPGDEALIVAPYWVSYLPMVQLAQGIGRVAFTSAATQWKVTPQMLQPLKSEKTKILILNNASNPTGTLYTKEEIEALLAWAKSHDIFVLSDEVYSELVYNGHAFVSCAAFPAFKENVLIVESCSKNFCMTGWRIGFAFGPTLLISAIARLQGQSTTGTSLVSQWAALAALEHAETISSYVRDEMCQRRDLFLKTFETFFGKSLPKVHSAIYYFISLQELNVSIRNSQLFCERVMEEASVALVPGIAFGAEGYVRFSFSESPDHIVQGLEALAHLCHKIRSWKG